MSLHPPTAICSGRLHDDDDDENKKRVLLTNPETERGAVFSTDQTAKQRPEWLFPRCPANMDYMLGCSLIITGYDKQNETVEDLQILRRDVWGDGEELEFVVRLHADDASGLKRSLERIYFQRACPHGIIVVVPCNPLFAPLMERASTEEEKEPFRKPLDMTLVRLLIEEEESMDRAMQSMMHNHHHHHHHNGN